MDICAPQCGGGGQFAEVGSGGGIPMASPGGVPRAVSLGLVGGSGPVRGRIEHVEPCPKTQSTARC